MVNLQQLERLKPRDSGRFGQACPGHRVRRARRTLYALEPISLSLTFPPEYALALHPAVRVTSSFTVPSSAIASHVVMPFLSLPLCE